MDHQIVEKEIIDENIEIQLQDENHELKDSNHELKDSNQGSKQDANSESKSSFSSMGFGWGFAVAAAQQQQPELISKPPSFTNSFDLSFFPCVASASASSLIPPSADCLDADLEKGLVQESLVEADLEKGLVQESLVDNNDLMIECADDEMDVDQVMEPVDDEPTSHLYRPQRSESMDTELVQDQADLVEANHPSIESIQTNATELLQESLIQSHLPSSDLEASSHNISVTAEIHVDIMETLPTEQFQEPVPAVHVFDTIQTAPTEILENSHIQLDGNSDDGNSDDRVPTVSHLDSYETAPTEAHIDSNETNETAPTEAHFDSNETAPTEGHIDSNETAPTEPHYNSNETAPTEAHIDSNETAPTEIHNHSNETAPTEAHANSNETTPTEIHETEQQAETEQFPSADPFNNVLELSPSETPNDGTNQTHLIDLDDSHQPASFTAPSESPSQNAQSMNPTLMDWHTQGNDDIVAPAATDLNVQDALLSEIMSRDINDNDSKVKVCLAEYENMVQEQVLNVISNDFVQQGDDVSLVIPAETVPEMDQEEVIGSSEAAQMMSEFESEREALVKLDDVEQDADVEQDVHVEQDADVEQGVFEQEEDVEQEHAFDESLAFGQEPATEDVEMMYEGDSFFAASQILGGPVPVDDDDQVSESQQFQESMIHNPLDELDNVDSNAEIQDILGDQSILPSESLDADATFENVLQESMNGMKSVYEGMERQVEELVQEMSKTPQVDKLGEKCAAVLEMQRKARQEMALIYSAFQEGIKVLAQESSQLVSFVAESVSGKAQESLESHLKAHTEQTLLLSEKIQQLESELEKKESTRQEMDGPVEMSRLLSDSQLDLVASNQAYEAIQSALQDQEKTALSQVQNACNQKVAETQALYESLQAEKISKETALVESERKSDALFVTIQSLEVSHSNELKRRESKYNAQIAELQMKLENVVPADSSSLNAVILERDQALEKIIRLVESINGATSQLQSQTVVMEKMVNDKIILVEKVSELETVVAQSQFIRNTELNALNEKCKTLTDTVEAKQAAISRLEVDLANATERQVYYEKVSNELQENVAFADQEQASLTEELRIASERASALENVIQKSVERLHGTFKAELEVDQLCQPTDSPEVQLDAYLSVLQEGQTSRASMQIKIDESEAKLIAYKKQFNSKLENQASKIRQLEAQVEVKEMGHQETIKALETKIETLERKEAATVNQINELEKKNQHSTDLQRENERLINELLISGRERDALNTKLNELSSAVSQAGLSKKALADLKVQYDEALAANEKVQTELELALKGHEEHLIQQNYADELRKAEFEASNIKMLKLADEIGSFHQKLEKTTTSMEELNQIKEAMALELKKVQEDLSASKSKEGTLSEQIATLQKEVENRRNVNSSLVKELAAQKLANTKLTEDLLTSKKSALTAVPVAGFPEASGASGSTVNRKKRTSSKMSAIPENKDSPAGEKTAATVLQESKKIKTDSNGATTSTKPRKRRESVRLDEVKAALEEEENGDENVAPSNSKTPVKQDAKVEKTPDSAQGRTRSALTNMYIGMSGFKEGTPFDPKLRTELVNAIKKLPNAKLITGSEGKDTFDARITHMISPPETKTLKTLAATLAGCWIISDPKWVLNSLKEKKWISEEEYGFRCIPSPFEGKSLYKSPMFEQQCKDKKASHSWPGFLELLWATCAKGNFVTSVKDADYVIVADSEKTQYGKSEQFNWYQLMAKIPCKKSE